MTKKIAKDFHFNHLKLGLEWPQLARNQSHSLVQALGGLGDRGHGSDEEATHEVDRDRSGGEAVSGLALHEAADPVAGDRADEAGGGVALFQLSALPRGSSFDARRGVRCFLDARRGAARRLTLPRRASIISSSNGPNRGAAAELELRADAHATHNAGPRSPRPQGLRHRGRIFVRLYLRKRR